MVINAWSFSPSTINFNTYIRIHIYVYVSIDNDFFQLEDKLLFFTRNAQHHYHYVNVLFVYLRINDVMHAEF